jgi:hypothetical protein
VESELFALTTAECPLALPFAGPQPFRTRAAFETTADGDNDVNVGDSVTTSLTYTSGPEHLSGFRMTNVRVGFTIGGTVVEIDRGTVDFPQPVTTNFVVGSTEHVVEADDMGSVVSLAVTNYFGTYYESQYSCTVRTGDGVVGVYVNRAPVVAGDAAETASGEGVTVDVLANDDVTNDSGMIAGSTPTADELLAQDDVATALPGQVVVTAQASDGECAVDADQQVTYTPDADFAGTDSCDYTVTDNDGASSTATLAVEVAEAVVVPVDPPVDEEPVDDPVVDEPVVDDGGAADDTSADDEAEADRDAVLPDTGGPDAGLLAVGALLVGAGAFAVVSGRRRLQG